MMISVLFLCFSRSVLAINNEIDNSCVADNIKILNNENELRVTSASEPPYPGNQNLSKRLFFIKNAYTGQYLDVSGGTAANGTNVQQYKFNGSAAQMWYVHSHGNGDFSLLSAVGLENNSYVYALDISNASSENYANAQIYKYNGTSAQKFCIQMTNYGTSHVILSKCSNYNKAIVVNGPSCNQGTNIDQYTFQKHYNEIWIFEPVSRDDNMGVKYALDDYNLYVAAYPNLTSMGGDCANFVSQCMLASGIHYYGDWRVYRKNSTYSKPVNVDQLNSTWELSDPSPWISAKYFSKFWKQKTNYHVYKGSYITSHPNEILNLNVTKGDVIQYAGSVLGVEGSAEHTMYITDYGQYNGNTSYVLTYHSSETKAKNLLEICANLPDKYFIIYEM